MHYLSPGSLCCQPKERCPPKAMVLVRKTGFPGLFDGPPGHGERSPETNPRVQIGHATLFWDCCSVELSNEIVSQYRITWSSKEWGLNDLFVEGMAKCSWRAMWFLETLEYALFPS